SFYLISLHNYSVPFISILLFLLFTPQLRSPLFPYTTLFRSLLPMETGHTMLQFLIERIIPGITVTIAVILIHLKTGLHYVILMLDRKSTRLNSSHVKISYAVFCLKKKNTSL